MMLPLPKLRKAICLGRSEPESIDIAVQDGPVQKLKCPTGQALPGCTALGSRVWFSDEEAGHGLGLWEIVEVDGGFLTCVNPTRIQAFFRQAFENSAIPEFQKYTRVTQTNEQKPYIYQLHDRNDQESCHVLVSDVILGDEIHRGFFPHAQNEALAQALRELIKLRYHQEDAAIVLGVANNGIERVFLADHIDRQVGGLVRDALDLGVKLYAFQIKTSLEAIELGQLIPARVLS